MRHGWLWLITLFCFSLLIGRAASAEQLTLKQRDQWLAEPQIALKADELKVLLENNQIEKLSSSLASLAFPQQEAVRYLVLNNLVNSQQDWSDELEHFIAQQRLLAPQFFVVEKGSGFEFMSPAFDYPALANRLIKVKQKARTHEAFLQAVNQRQLDLKSWLTGEPETVERNQVLLSQEIPKLSIENADYLADQIATEKVISWLPSNQVLVELAKATQDPRLYKLLWLKHADLYAEREVERLASVADHFSISQMIYASENPQLKQSVQALLAQIYPMSELAKLFFIEQLTKPEEVDFVAKALITHGYRSWLEELLNSEPSIASKPLQRVLNE